METYRLHSSLLGAIRPLTGFNKTLPVDHNFFTNHQFANWYAYLSKAKAVSLKIVKESSQFSLESVATGVHPLKLSNTFFALPADVQAIKSPYWIWGGTLGIVAGKAGAIKDHAKAA